MSKKIFPNLRSKLKIIYEKRNKGVLKIKSKKNDDENGNVIRVFSNLKLNYDFYNKID